MRIILIAAQHARLYSVRRLFRGHVDPAHSPPPTVCLVRLFIPLHNIALLTFFLSIGVVRTTQRPQRTRIFLASGLGSNIDS